MAAAFERTGGSIAAVLREMFLHPAFLGGLGEDAGGKFKDPMQFVVSSLRLADNERPITNLRPAVRWLQALGQPLYGRVTPDGYPLTEAAWTSSGQLVQRFEIARAIGGGNADLAGEPDDDAWAARTRHRSGPAFAVLQRADRAAALVSGRRQALQATTSPREWNALLLSSPDWMLR